MTNGRSLGKLPSMHLSPQWPPVAALMAATGHRGAHARPWIAGWAVALVLLLAGGVWWWRRRKPAKGVGR
jgi:hypothetical protein